MEPPSPFISWVNPFPSRFITRTACFPRKVSYFRESRMSPWKKWSWMKSNSEARPSTVFLFYYTSIFTILQPLGSGNHETKVNWDWAWSDGTKAASWGSRKGYLCECLFFFFFAVIHSTFKHAWWASGSVACNGCRQGFMVAWVCIAAPSRQKK